MRGGKMKGSERLREWRHKNPKKEALAKDKDAARRILRRYGNGWIEFVIDVKNESAEKSEIVKP